MMRKFFMVPAVLVAAVAPAMAADPHPQAIAESLSQKNAEGSLPQARAKHGCSYQVEFDEKTGNLKLAITKQESGLFSFHYEPRTVEIAVSDFQSKTRVTASKPFMPLVNITAYGYTGLLLGQGKNSDGSVSKLEIEYNNDPRVDYQYERALGTRRGDITYISLERYALKRNDSFSTAVGGAPETYLERYPSERISCGHSVCEDAQCWIQ